MHQHLRVVAAVVMAGVVAVGLGACDLSSRATFTDSAVLSGKVTSVRLDLSSGDVELRGRDGATEVAVHRSVEHRGDRPDGSSHRVEDGVLVLRGCGRDCSVSYRIDLPAGLPVSGALSSGDVTLSGVGAVEIKTSSGDVKLDGVTGAVDVRTGNGEILGRGLRGDRIHAETSNGEITLSAATSQDVLAKSSDGGITLTVPAGTTYRVTAATNDGDKRIGLPHDPAGKHRLDLTTGSGDITVSTA